MFEEPEYTALQLSKQHPTRLEQMVKNQRYIQLIEEDPAKMWELTREVLARMGYAEAYIKRAYNAHLTAGEG